MQKIKRKISFLAVLMLSLLLIIAGLFIASNAIERALGESYKAEFLRVLQENKGNYNENVLVFDNSPDIAQKVATKCGGKLRTDSTRCSASKEKRYAGRSRRNRL